MVRKRAVGGESLFVADSKSSNWNWGNPKATCSSWKFQIVVDPARELQLGKLPSVFRILRGELQMFGRTLTMEYAADQMGNCNIE